jgi:hypothetical protein
MRPAAAALLSLFFMSMITPEARASGDAGTVARITLKGQKLLETLAERNIEILGMGRDGTIDVLVDDEQLAYLRAQNVLFTLPPPVEGAFAAALDANLGLYHTYAEMQTELDSLVATYPSLASKQSIGTSIEGRQIYVLKISDNVATDESEPEALIMGNLHAREIMSVEIPLKFAGYLLSNYGSDPTVTSRVNDLEIFILPMANPDGHVYVETNDSGNPWQTWWRKNRRPNSGGSVGVDLNRNFGYQWGFDNIGSSPTQTSAVYRGTGAFSEPETQRIRDFCNARNFTVGLSYHSYGELLLFPWGYAYEYTAEHEVFVTLGDSLASTNGYLVGNPAMGAIYRTNGDSDDWAYGDDTGKPAFFLFTPEINSYAQGGFGPAESFIQPTFDLLLPMNMTLLALADDPYRIVPPRPPALLAIDATGLNPPQYRLTWSGPDPADPNTPTGYDVIEYTNLDVVPQDGANSASSLWAYGGFTVSTARAYEGSGSYYSGAADNTSSRLEAATFFSVSAETDTFSAQVWYDIESDYDYAYLEVSTDGGLVWESVPGNITTNSNPHGSNRGNGITGFSPTWMQAIFPLSAYAGSEIRLRWNYQTDGAVLGEGIYLDLLGPVPTYESVKTVASNQPDTTLVIWPISLGTFTYVVRARDAEDDRSRWSNAEDWGVSSPTGVTSTPVLATGLERNYPNPFNPTTTIPYTIGGPSNAPVPVRLFVYDVTGARVATLVEREMPPGAYRAVWKGRDDRGRELPSGVYFIRLTHGTETLTRKVALLK